MFTETCPRALTAAWLIIVKRRPQPDSSPTDGRIDRRTCTHAMEQHPPIKRKEVLGRGRAVDHDAQPKKPVSKSRTLHDSVHGKCLEEANP